MLVETEKYCRGISLRLRVPWQQKTRAQSLRRNVTVLAVEQAGGREIHMGACIFNMLRVGQKLQLAMVMYFS